MSTTQQPEALNLEEFRAKVTHAAREPLLARIAELEAQLSAIGAGGVEPLRKRAAPAALAVPDERKAFEAWANSYGTWEVKHDDDPDLGTTGYTDVTLTVAWHAIQSRAALAATPAADAGNPVSESAAPAVLPEPVPSGMRLVNAGALQMVINALRRDAEEGKAVRGEMADELLATGGQAQTDALDAARYRWLRNQMLGVDFDWCGNGITALVFEVPDGCAYSRNCDQSIDAAVAAQAKQGEPKS